MKITTTIKNIRMRLFLIWSKLTWTGEVKGRNYCENLIFMDGKNLVFTVIQFRTLEVSVKYARMSCFQSLQP